MAAALRGRYRRVAFHPSFEVGRVAAVFSKGEYSAAYSGFEGADDNGTPLGQWLHDHGARSVDVVGIATDHCVRATAVDAAGAGFRTRVLLNFTAAVGADTVKMALGRMREAGVELVGDLLYAGTPRAD